MTPSRDSTAGVDVVLLSAEQCEACAEDMLDALSVCEDPEMRAWLACEVREWQTLAADRAQEDAYA